MIAGWDVCGRVGVSELVQARPAFQQRNSLARRAGVCRLRAAGPFSVGALIGHDGIGYSRYAECPFVDDMDRLFARRRNVTIHVDYPRSAMVAASKRAEGAGQDRALQCRE